MIVEKRIDIDRDWCDYPVGTKAYSYLGGHWTKTVHGWKWFTSSTFTTPGADARRVSLPDEKPFKGRTQRNTGE